jgi:hypothetical protein
MPGVTKLFLPSTARPIIEVWLSHRPVYGVRILRVVRPNGERWRYYQIWRLRLATRTRP